VTPPHRSRQDLPASVRRIVERARSTLGDRRASVRYEWLRRLSGGSREQLSSVLAELDELLPFEDRIRRHHRSGGRPHYAQFRAPFELYALVRLTEPDHVVETGVSSGVSSAHLLLAVRKNRHGAVHSIDLPLPQRSDRFSANESPVALPPGRSSGWALPEELRDGWDLRLGPSERLLPKLVDELPSVGIFLHDSQHTPRHLTFELSTVHPKLHPGSVVIADNTVWTGDAFPRFARKVGASVVRRGRSDLVGLRMP
jgi:hypothetical protein